MKAIDPRTGELIREYEEDDEATVRSRLEKAERTFGEWRETTFAERTERMHAAAGVLREDLAKWAELMVLEMGKPIGAAESEAEKCAWVCDFYADQAERFLAPEEIGTDATKSYVRYDPLGPVLAVMPWNFPFWQVFRFAAPGLMAGNVGLLKHASNVPGCALAIEEIFLRAGFPEGCFQTLMIGSGAVESVILDPTIRAVTLTGSEPAGMAVASAAGRSLKKTVLELGGSDPFIVLADANLDQAVETAVTARTINSGQSCIAAKRFIVEAPVFSAFEAAFTKRMGDLVFGDPMDRATQVGPLARPDLVEDLHSQVLRSVGAGAVLLLGGSPSDRAGAWYPPTVLSQVRPGMPAFDEETFGPVAALIEAEDAHEAIALANRSEFGLGASLWTRNTARGEELAARIEAGCVFLNGLVKSDPRLPFGGVKRSGYGRELSAVGIREFVNQKTVWVK